MRIVVSQARENTWRECDLQCRDSRTPFFFFIFIFFFLLALTFSPCTTSFALHCAKATPMMLCDLCVMPRSESIDSTARYHEGFSFSYPSIRRKKKSNLKTIRIRMLLYCNYFLTFPRSTIQTNRSRTRLPYPPPQLSSGIQGDSRCCSR